MFGEHLSGGGKSSLLLPEIRKCGFCQPATEGYTTVKEMNLLPDDFNKKGQMLLNSIPVLSETFI